MGPTHPLQGESPGALFSLPLCMVPLCTLSCHCSLERCH